MSGPHRLGMLQSDLRLLRRPLIIWALSVVGLVLLVVVFYPTIRDQSSLDSIYADLSPALQSLLGGSDITSPVGYLNTQLFAFFMPAVLLVFALGRSAGGVAGEEEAHTLDLLLAQPLPRRSLYLQKCGTLVLGLTALTVATWLPLALVDSVVGFNLALADLAAVCLQMLLFCCALGLSAQAISTLVGRRAMGTAIITGYTAVSYVVYGLGATVSSMEALRPLSLWRWYLANEPLRSGLGLAEVLVMAATCAVAITVGVLAFERRDVRS